MLDRYDQEVAYLTAHPEKIRDAWFMLESWFMLQGDRKRHSPLFDPIGRDRTVNACGCITEIRNCSKVAETYELTELIRSDERLPWNAATIHVRHLPMFAELQRLADKELGREPPPLLEEADVAALYSQDA